jgi:uncharacterized membrane protein YkgB
MDQEKGFLTRFDASLRSWMRNAALPLMRYSLALIFIWFGALKPFGLSPAADLAASTVAFIPREIFIPVLGWWEVAIGVCFLFRPLVRVAIPLLALQIPGTFLPLLLLPQYCFTQFPYAVTIEGQYIIKNLLIIGCAMAIGGALPPISPDSQRQAAK